MTAINHEKEMSETQKELLGLIHWIRGFKSAGTSCAPVQPTSFLQAITCSAEAKCISPVLQEKNRLVSDLFSGIDIHKVYG